MRLIRLAAPAAPLALTALLLFAARPAEAAVTGGIQGVVTDGETRKPLAGVTVEAIGPQGSQTEFTDGTGRYSITDLMPGEYVVRFYFSTVKVERPGVLIQADKTLSVGAVMPTGKAKETRYVIKERAPNIDVASTQVQTQITSELVRNVPAGRTYASVLTLAPGSATDPVGYSFSGATGPENQFLINGLNTTNPSDGLLGTNLSLEFIGETQIIVGGYNAEFGRATGGIVNVITKSGTNQFHGGAWVFYTPLVLEPPRIARPGEAVARIQRNVANALDFGVDIGGPIIKDRLFFYAGFAPSFSTATYERILRRRLANDFDPKATLDYPGDLDTSITCPPWLAERSEALCAASKAAAYKTEDLDSRFFRRYQSDTRRYQAIGKLDLRINDNHNLSLTYIAVPTTFDGVSGSRFNGNPATGVYDFTQPAETHDLIGHYTGKLLDRRLQLDAQVGWHYEKASTLPTTLGASQGSNVDTRAQSISVFEDELEPCKIKGLQGEKAANGDPRIIKFNPCPVSGYRDAGFGFISESTNQRAAAMASVTYFAKLLGAHAVKLGGDFEFNWFRDYRSYTGSGGYTTFGGATPTEPVVLKQQYGQIDPKDPNRVVLFDGKNGQPLGFTATTTTYNYSLYLRDSWNVSFAPGLTVNLGLRWEAQQVRDIDDKIQIGIYDNIAPRVGLVYDVLAKGRGKLFANYGRYYESIPLTINNRQFSREGIVTQLGFPEDKGACKTDPNGRLDVTTCDFPPAAVNELNGGVFGKVSPLLQGQFSNEVVVGGEYSPGLDLVFGATFIHRDLGRVIEDISADGGRTYVIANPGVAPDAGTVKKVQGQINDVSKQIQGTTDPAKLEALGKQRTELSQQLALYNTASVFETPKRDYNALQVTVTKRLSYNFTVLGSYTYSRTLGNYPGLFQASNGQLDPNISSQYDLPELLVNRNGPLPNDRPHNFKITGAYRQPLGRFGGLTLGANFLAQSGTPIEVLGRHPTYGANETFILQRGAGGRLPMLTQLDLRLAYWKEFAHNVRIEASLEIFNVLNQQQVTSVDQAFTPNSVLPIPNGKYSDLKFLTTTSGVAATLNPNYGQPTGYQAPLSLRAGARVSF